MNIQWNKIPTDFNGHRCYVHARGVIRPDGFAVMTTQKLELESGGYDVFYGLEMMKSTDYGETFSKPVTCENLKRTYLEDGTSYVLCDASPFYHGKTGKILLTGLMERYGENNRLLGGEHFRQPLYAVYNEETGDFDAARILSLPHTENEEYFAAGSGCVQIAECENGDLLVPFYYKPRATAAAPGASYAVAVARCAFDGEEMRVLEVGNKLFTEVPRGFCEPSIVRFGEEYLIALRNDVTGFIAKSKDGLHFDTPVELCFADGENLGNYNTQQHWLVGGGKLWLAYTRKTDYNGHMFRHRAPLFLAEFDPVKMGVVRETEKVAVPERGARLGNFGCFSYSDEIGYIFDAEWMQNDPQGWEVCAARGSDNTIFVSKVTYND